MGRITDEDIQRVRDATDLVEVVSDTVVLKRQGRLLWGRCPFHNEKTASFKVDPTTQLWHCFGCGLGGDVFGFVMRTENLDFPEAVRQLADRAHVEIVEVGGGIGSGRRERLYAACNEAASHYHKVLVGGTDAGAARARDYLGARGFGTPVAKRFELGYAPGGSALSRALKEAGFPEDDLIEANLALRPDAGARSGSLRDRFFDRIMFPIRDVQGRCVGFGGRVLGSGQPKYLNTQETPIFHKSQNLYGIDQARNDLVAEKTAIVVEGYTDVIAMREAGVKNVVATLGTALTREHMKVLGRFARRVVYLFDGDEAGLRAADRASEFIGFDMTPEAGRERVDLLVAVIPGGQDPADFVSSAGTDAVRALVADAVPLLRFAIDRRLEQHDLSDPENRTRAMGEAASVLATVKTSLLVHDYTNYVADKLFVEYATVQKAVANAKPIPSAQEQDARGTEDQGRESAQPAVSTPQSRAELEYLGALATVPRLRSEARFLLSDDLLTVPIHRRALDLMATHTTEAIEELVSGIQEADPEMASLFAGMTAVDEGNAESVSEDLMARLKEFRVDRLILTKKSELKSLDAASDAERYDALFREVSDLQQEKNLLRTTRSASE